MNKVIQTVTLCADPEIRAYGGDNANTLARFNGAVNKRFKRDSESSADFFNYVAFGKTAEFIEKYFKKGSKMLVIGEVNNNNYTDKDGVKHYGTQILIESVEFYGKKSDNENSVPADTNAGNKPAPSTAASDTSGAESYNEYEDF